MQIINEAMLAASKSIKASVTSGPRAEKVWITSSTTPTARPKTALLAAQIHTSFAQNFSAFIKRAFKIKNKEVKNPRAKNSIKCPPFRVIQTKYLSSPKRNSTIGRISSEKKLLSSNESGFGIIE